MSVLDSQRISGWRKGIPLKCQHDRRAYTGVCSPIFTFALPPPSYPAKCIREAKEQSLEGREDFLWSHQKKLTMSPSHSAFSANHNSRAEELCASSLKLRQPQGFLGLLLYSNHTSL